MLIFAWTAGKNRGYHRSGNSKKCINESEIAERANVGIIEGQTQAKLPHLDLE